MDSTLAFWMRAKSESVPNGTKGAESACPRFFAARAAAFFSTSSATLAALQLCGIADD